MGVVDFLYVRPSVLSRGVGVGVGGVAPTLGGALAGTSGGVPSLNVEGYLESAQTVSLTLDDALKLYRGLRIAFLLVET